ncbi:MAG: DinB family protein [Acidobacteriia bacterium]|nr:DinB family protein [Terriglobia bacterium]MBV8902750.1 DinB family protein [Terriglobia bacterium]
MTISETLLPEFDNEMANTRKTLERVPDDKFDWKPHPKSFAMGPLAIHLATLVGWTNDTIAKDNFDVAPQGQSSNQPPAIKSRADLLKTFDEGVVKARTALAGASDEHLLKPWSLLAGGKTLMTMPRTAVIRSFVLSHVIHHRAQLGVYLRLNDIPVPSIYGPSADENPFF